MTNPTEGRPVSELTVEVVPTGPSGDLASTRAIPPEVFAQRAEEIADAVRDVARRFQDRLDIDAEAAMAASGWTMSQVKLSFQIAVTAGTGVVIARASAAASFTAELTWTRKS